MNKLILTGVILLVLGVVALVTPALRYTEREEILKIGPIEATAETQKRVPIPPLVGWALVVGGLGLAVAGLKGRK